jgi:hypothetical protein
LLSGPMMSPLVVSRQPCITPGAGHCFGKGVGGSGGGGGGVELGWGLSSGLVVNGAEAASLNRAQPVDITIAAPNTASPHRTERRNRMTDRLRTLRVGPPQACRYAVRHVVAPAIGRPPGFRRAFTLSGLSGRIWPCLAG